MPLCSTTSAIVDLTAERLQRQALARQATEGADIFVAGLRRAGLTLANLAWVLAAPVRHHDRELKEGIYELVLARLHRIIAGSMQEIDGALDVKAPAMDQAVGVAFAAFKAQLIALAAAEQSRSPGSMP